MSRLSEEYGIEEDSRYAACEREAAFSFLIFLLAAAASIGSFYGLTVGRVPDAYGAVFGLPSYLFWGIVATDLAFLVALLVGLRTIFRDVDLDPVDPRDPVDPSTHPERPGG